MGGVQEIFELSTAEVAVGMAANDAVWAVEMTVMMMVEKVLRKVGWHTMQIAGLGEEDAEQKAVELNSGAVGAAAGARVGTTVDVREFGKFEEEGDQYGKIGRLPEAED